MATVKAKAYYRAVRRAIEAVHSDLDLPQVLDYLVRTIARSMECGVSLISLNRNTGTLLHQVTSGLPENYIKKGLLDAQKSLREVLTGQTIAVTDITGDSRIQYPEPARKCGICSILAVPLFNGTEVSGSIRVYAMERTEFSNSDINFVTTITKLAALSIRNRTLSREKEAAEEEKNLAESRMETLTSSRPVKFAHPSEEEFARILDFYRIEWAYEPRSFPLQWENDRITEMFTPDFYLPAFDLYIEVTTRKQSLITIKNRKLRHLRELYPDIRIMLLNKKDIDQFLARFGYGPLAQTRSRGVASVLFSEEEINTRVRELAQQISRDYEGLHPVMVGVLRGVFCFMADLIRQVSIPVDVEFMAISYFSNTQDSAVKITKDIDVAIAGRHVIMVEDIVDTGMTLRYMLNYLSTKNPASLEVCTLLDKRERRLIDIPLRYTGFEIPDSFVIGYGLDYREEYRNLPFIGILETEKSA